VRRERILLLHTGPPYLHANRRQLLICHLQQVHGGTVSEGVQPHSAAVKVEQTARPLVSGVRRATSITV
jgi:hypothetical protein